VSLETPLAPCPRQPPRLAPEEEDCAKRSAAGSCTNASCRQNGEKQSSAARRWDQGLTPRPVQPHASRGMMDMVAPSADGSRLWSALSREDWWLQPVCDQGPSPTPLCCCPFHIVDLQPGFSLEERVYSPEQKKLKTAAYRWTSGLTAQTHSTWCVSQMDCGPSGCSLSSGLRSGAWGRVKNKHTSLDTCLCRGHSLPSVYPGGVYMTK